MPDASRPVSRPAPLARALRRRLGLVRAGRRRARWPRGSARPRAAGTAGWSGWRARRPGRARGGRSMPAEAHQRGDVPVHRLRLDLDVAEFAARSIASCSCALICVIDWLDRDQYDRISTVARPRRSSSSRTVAIASARAAAAVPRRRRSRRRAPGRPARGRAVHRSGGSEASASSSSSRAPRSTKAGRQQVSSKPIAARASSSPSPSARPTAAALRYASSASSARARAHQRLAAPELELGSVADVADAELERRAEVLGRDVVGQARHRVVGGQAVVADGAVGASPAGSAAAKWWASSAASPAARPRAPPRSRCSSARAGRRGGRRRLAGPVRERTGTRARAGRSPRSARSRSPRPRPRPARRARPAGRAHDLEIEDRARDGGQVEQVAGAGLHASDSLRDHLAHASGVATSARGTRRNPDPPGDRAAVVQRAPELGDQERVPAVSPSIAPTTSGCAARGVPPRGRRARRSPAP